MIPHWPFWLGGVLLAVVPLLHWFLLGRMFAVSSRFAAITDWLSAPSAAGAAATAQGIVFFAAVAAGGTLSAWLAGGPPRPHLPAGQFVRFFGDRPVVELAILFGGGLLVGFGTRMATGCTSGHGLCGTSRLQPGSLVATACFFGFGIAVSFALRLFLGGGA